MACMFYLLSLTHFSMRKICELTKMKVKKETRLVSWFRKWNKQTHVELHADLATANNHYEIIHLAYRDDFPDVFLFFIIGFIMPYYLVSLICPVGFLLQVKSLMRRKMRELISLVEKI